MFDARDETSTFPDFDFASGFCGKSGGHFESVEIVVQGTIVTRHYLIGIIDAE
jgi:NADH:ubiquinone oxidoreductase subunit B-like Fe-S oxidoreductase